MFNSRNIICFTFLVCGIFNVFASAFLSITTDKARYAPGEPVELSVQLEQINPGAKMEIYYSHLNEQIDTRSINAASDPVSWIWQPPQTDYRGYLVTAVLYDGTKAADTTRIAVDVSSYWAKFPRYGFLSKYPYLSTLQIENTIKRLNRYHINGLQFYDWHYKHHMPLKGSPDHPAEFWNDIANRTNYLQTVSGYIKAARQKNIMTMSYNLLYGAYRDAVQDGVPVEWRLFRDRGHNLPDYFDLPSTWASDIYLINPSNPQWISYILENTKNAFSVLNFDGWHIDQLGDRGTLYNFVGEEVNLTDAYLPFIQQSKNSLSASLIMNAVNQYGQSEIAKAPVDFLYTEVWPPNDSYNSLVSIIRQNASWANGTPATVLAAYMNKAQSTQSGIFNTPAVLLTDAVIFAAGGAHLELGEHMLANEYFPNDNLQMSNELENRLIAYYDFLVAYQNLLRDGGDFNQDYLHSEGEIAIRNAARKGSIWGFSKTVHNRQIFHLINLLNAKSLDWRDDDGDQSEPDLIKNIRVSFTTKGKVQSLWLASPDINGGMAINLAYEEDGDTVGFYVPFLKYWDVIVADYGPTEVMIMKKNTLPENLILYSNYPNPFNIKTRLMFNLRKRTKLNISIYNLTGRKIAGLADREFSEGEHSIDWKPAGHLSSGLYHAVFFTNDGEIFFRKMIFLK